MYIAILQDVSIGSYLVPTIPTLGQKEKSKLRRRGRTKINKYKRMDAYMDMDEQERRWMGCG